MNEQDWTAAEDLLERWRQRARVAGHAHRLAGKHFRIKALVVGSTLVLLSALVSTTLAARLEAHDFGRWVVAGLGALVAVLAAYQTFRGFQEQAETHETIRAGFGSLCREIEHIQALTRESRPTPNDALSRIRSRYDDLSRTNVPVPEKVWKKAEVEMKQSKDD